MIWHSNCELNRTARALGVHQLSDLSFAVTARSCGTICSVQSSYRAASSGTVKEAHKFAAAVRS